MKSFLPIHNIPSWKARIMQQLKENMIFFTWSYPKLVEIQKPPHAIWTSSGNWINISKIPSNNLYNLISELTNVWIVAWNLWFLCYHGNQYQYHSNDNKVWCIPRPRYMVITIKQHLLVIVANYFWNVNIMVTGQFHYFVTFVLHQRHEGGFRW